MLCKSWSLIGKPIELGGGLRLPALFLSRNRDRHTPTQVWLGLQNHGAARSTHTPR